MPNAPLRLWLDAQLPPKLARWLTTTFGVVADHVLDIGLLRAADEEIFARARAADVVVLTKDVDFVQLLERHGQPPRVVWLTVGNVTNARLREILTEQWPHTATLLELGEPLIEITGR